MSKHAQFLSAKKLKGTGIIRVAAKHNLRELCAEVGVYGSIDGQRCHLNYILRGAGTAAEVARDAKSKMDEAGIKNLRKDAVLGLEVVISLRLNSTIDSKSFFRDSLAWLEGYYQAPVISAVVHLDQNAPHCHVIILPLVDGRMNGSRLMGYKRKLQSMQANFNRKVGKHYGLTYQGNRKNSLDSKLHLDCQSILETIKAHPERLNESALCQALMIAFSHNSNDLLLALEMKSVSISSIGFDNNLTVGDMQRLSRVGFKSQGTEKPVIRRSKLLSRRPVTAEADFAFQK